jgi:hypothetical protein
MTATAEPARLRSFCSLATPHPAALARSMRGTQALRSAYVGLFQVPMLPEVLLGACGGTGLRLLLERSGLPAADARRAADALDVDALGSALDWYRQINPGRLARAEAVWVPTLFVWGNRDAALGRAAAETTATYALGPYRFVELDASHWLVETREAEVIGLIEAHLARQRSSVDAPPDVNV